MTRTLPRARQLGSRRTDSPPGLDYLLRHEVSVASESMHGMGVTIEQLIYCGRAEGWLNVPSLERDGR